METEIKTTETEQAPVSFKNMLSAEAKQFIGFLLSIAGVIFILLGLMIFIALAYAINAPSHDIVVGLIIGSCVVGIISFGVGSFLSGKK